MTAAEIAALGPWFHNLHLPDGACTAPGHPLGDFPARVWQTVAPRIPQNLEGWSVLDVGCNAGFYSIEFARRGAQVLAIDHDERYLRQARWAAPQFGVAERIEFARMDVYDLGHRDRSFDLVSFLGVFYHLRYPLLALDLLACRVRRLLVFQTLSLPGEPGIDDTPVDLPLGALGRLTEPDWPRVAFVEHSLDGDPTNWWVPDRAAAAALLRSSGLQILDRDRGGVYFCAPDPDESADARERRARELAAALGASRS